MLTSPHLRGKKLKLGINELVLADPSRFYRDAILYTMSGQMQVVEDAEVVQLFHLIHGLWREV